MTLQRQPNNWSCLITSFAMVLNEPVKQLIQEVGHDGSKIIRPNQPPPSCYRGFHPFEINKLCYKRNKALIFFDSDPMFYANGDIYQIGSDLAYILSIIKNNIGVLCGNYRNSTQDHSVAWNGYVIYDPSGVINPLNLFKIREFYVIKDFK